jgi:hypothetical protein
MKTTILALLVSVLGACGDMAANEPDATPDAIVTGCCRHYASGLSVPGCWVCSDGVLRCVGTTCEAGSAAMPMCSDQPSAPWPSDSPSCD